MNSTRKENIQIVWTGTNRLEKQRKKQDFELSISQNAKQNKTKKYIKSIKKIWEKKKAIWISHLTRQSFINSLSKQWLVLESELALKKYSVFQEATHSMSFSTLSFSPFIWGIKQHPSILCLQYPAAHPALALNLVVCRPRPLKPVPHPLQKTTTVTLFSKARTLHSKSSNLCVKKN